MNDNNNMLMSLVPNSANENELIGVVALGKFQKILSRKFDKLPILCSSSKTSLGLIHSSNDLENFKSSSHLDTVAYFYFIQLQC